MALENLVGPNVFITSLNPANPPPNDPAEEGAAHISGTKNAVLNSFPNINAAVTATPAQLNSVTQIPGKVTKAYDTELGGLAWGVNGTIQFVNATGAVQWSIGAGLFEGSGNLLVYNAILGGYAVTINKTNNDANFAGRITAVGAITSSGDIVTSNASAVTGLSVGVNRAVAALNGGSWPGFNWYIGGVNDIGAYMVSDGSVRWIAGTDITSNIIASVFPAQWNFNVQVSSTKPGATRTNTGFSSAVGDIGKAPGIYRGSGTANANGDVQFNFGFQIPDPKIIATAYKTDTPVICTIIEFTTTYAIVRASQWNGTTFIASPGTLINCMAVDNNPQPN